MKRDNQMKVQVQWLDNVAFRTIGDSNHEIIVDGPPESGGENRGARPMELVLMGLGGCTSFDIVDILNIKGMTNLSRHAHTGTRSYDVYVIGQELDDDVMRYIYNGISHEKFPTIVSQYDYFMEDTLSDCFLSTRTHSVNTMRHGAELS